MFNLTTDGHEAYTAELEQKLAQRPSVVAELSRARDMGDRSENAAYKVARSQLSALDRRIRFLQKLLHTARVVKPHNTERFFFGLRVFFECLVKSVCFGIVFSVLSYFIRGFVWVGCRLGSALMHKQLGDVVTYDTPRGQKVCTITLISYQ